MPGYAKFRQGSSITAPLTLSSARKPRMSSCVPPRSWRSCTGQWCSYRSLSGAAFAISFFRICGMEAQGNSPRQHATPMSLCAV